MAENTIKDVKLKIGTETQFQSKLKDLPLNTLVGTTDPIQEGELDTSIITKLNKAENALPKPTNDTTGSAGQVLKKTANGSEWGDAPSGGGKLYLHRVSFVFENDAMYVLTIDIPTNTNNDITLDFLRNYLQGYCTVCYNGEKGIGVVTLNSTSNNIDICGSVTDIVPNAPVNSVYINYKNTNGLAINSQILIEL